MVPMGMWPSKRPPQGSTPSSSIRRSLSLRLASKTSGGSGTVSWLSCEKAVPNKALRSTYSAESHVSYAKGESHALTPAEGESHVSRSYAEAKATFLTPKALHNTAQGRVSAPWEGAVPPMIYPEGAAQDRD